MMHHPMVSVRSDAGLLPSSAAAIHAEVTADARERWDGLYAMYRPPVSGTRGWMQPEVEQRREAVGHSFCAIRAKI